MMKIVDYSYLLTPFLAWFVAGLIKLVINSIQSKRLAFGLIGYGGMPSYHRAIVSTWELLDDGKQWVSKFIL